MGQKEIEAILAALRQGERVELTMDTDGTITARTVRRKKLKLSPTA